MRGILSVIAAATLALSVSAIPTFQQCFDCFY